MFGSSTVAPQVAGVLSGASSTISEVKYALFSRCAKCVSYRRYTKSLSQQESSSTTNEDAKSSNVISKQAIQDLGLKDLPNDWLKKVDIPNTAWLNLPDERSKPWNISHVSAETFFQNKHGFDPSKIYHEEHLRAGVSLFSIFKGKENLLVNSFKQGIQKRFKMSFAPRNRVMYLETIANKESGNPDAQAEYLKAIINEDPEYVIRRCESGQFAINDDVITQYFKALVLTDKVSSSEIQALGNAALSKTGSKGNSNLNAFNPDRGTEDQPVHVVMNPAKGSFFREQFWNTLRFLIGLFLILSVIEAQLQMKMTTNQKEIMPDQSEKRVKFSDVQGCDEAKQELKEVVEFLRSPDKFTKLGGKLPTGVLLIGPPGTGKTLLARAVAGEAGVPFFFCSGSEFDEMFVGVGAARVRNLFTAAKEHSPCIVFVDELDAIGGTRIPNDHQPYSRMTLNQLLVELDGFDKTEGIVVIGATNFPEILDKALTRPGRFDSKVIVAIPDVRGRKEILDLYLKTVPCGDDVDSTVIARGTPGFSGADLNNLVNQAAIRAAVESDPYVTLKHLEWAKDKIIMGPERKNAVIEEKNRILVAYHESGHAVVAMYTPDALPVHKATIMPRGQALGMVSQLPEKDELSWSKKQLLAKMDVCMGGRVAEEIIFGKDSITTGASSDMETATKIATAMVVKYGMSEKVGVVNIGDTDKLSPSLRATVENEINTLLKESYERARSILTARASEHKRLAEGLLVHETLDSDELKLVVQGKQLPSKI
ncbi:uncharacterized protein LOC135682293 [Rhopilema esculentum]|uniref:uncharacterized protein LOC135682293 n=1 Tax=Rhopilema esculentum TaxID=499914 RepID=UPI0031DABA9E